MTDIFQKRLKKLRLSKGKTQDEVANALNIKRSTYGAYERGKIMPPVEKLEQLAKIFHTTPQYLVGWDVQETDGRIPFETVERIAKDFGVSVDVLGGQDFFKSEDEASAFEAAMNLMQQAKKWNEAIGNIHFTDEELDELINYAKYIIAKRDNT